MTAREIYKKHKIFEFFGCVFLALNTQVEKRNKFFNADSDSPDIKTVKGARKYERM